MTRTAALLAAGMLLAALTGCVSTAEAVPPTSEPPSPTSSAQPQPTIVAKPALAFGGSCEALVDDAALSELVGASMATSELERSERVWAVAVLGGLDCGWTSDSEAYVWLDLIPAAGLEALVAHAEADSPYCYGGEAVESRCSFSTVVGGYWLSGIVGVANGSSNTAIDAIDVLTARIAESAAASGARPRRATLTACGRRPPSARRSRTASTPRAFSARRSSREKGNVGGEATSGFVAALARGGRRVVHLGRVRQRRRVHQ